MTVSLKGKNAIITGAAVGIGPAYAEALAAEGCNVAVCDIREEIMDLPAKLEAQGVKAVGWVADVSVPEDVRKVVDGTIEAFGGIDILINNAGKCWVSLADDDLDKTLDDYEGMVGTNLKGEYLMGRAVIEQLLKQGRGGEIINVSTDHHFTCGSPFELCTDYDCPHPKPRPSGGGEVMDIYDASKSGLHGILYAWAKALRPHGIRVNGMCMGATDSWMIRDFFGFPQTRDEEDEEQKAEVDTWMAKEDTAQVVMDLLKEGPEGRTAQNINLCVGRPTVLEPPLPNIYITEESLNVA
ncbi:MAG: SDR family NAD(P)-dependent oxidoreductase [Alphaproteobacteria bacterium]